MEESPTTDLRVLFVQPQLCTRAWKEAKALAERGVTMGLVELSQPCTRLDYSVFSRVERVPVARDVRSLVSNHRRVRAALAEAARGGDWDLVHSHNAPDALGAWMPRLVSQPTIHDVHDMQSEVPKTYARNALRRAAIERLERLWERQACTRSSAVVTTSPPMEATLRERYASRRTLSLENKPVEAPFRALPKLSRSDGETHLVLAGGMNLTPGSTRNLLPAMRAFARQRLQVHLYPVTYTAEEQERLRLACERNRRLHFHEAVPQEDFIREMSQYDYGLLWFASTHRNLELTTANRAYEFQVAGVPTVTNLRHGYIGRYVADRQCGIVADTPEQAARAMREARAFRLDRTGCFLDVTPLLDLYEELAGRLPPSPLLAPEEAALTVGGPG